MVSNGCPTRTCAAPPTLPAMSSFIVACVVDFIFELTDRGNRNALGLGVFSISVGTISIALGHAIVDHMIIREKPKKISLS